MRSNRSAKKPWRKPSANAIVLVSARVGPDEYVRSARDPRRGSSSGALKSKRQARTNPKKPNLRLKIERAIRAIPRGKVSTYGGVARAAGLPGASRQVAAVLRNSFGLPWQRVLGAGGEIKLRGDSAIEQRLRLEAEGVRFRGRKVDMKAHEFKSKRNVDRN